jgi:hypothetical protein
MLCDNFLNKQGGGGSGAGAGTGSANLFGANAAGVSDYGCLNIIFYACLYVVILLGRSF